MDVSIIIINYNTFELTKNAIESIYNNTTDISYEIILIDNQSPDDSGKKLHSLFPSIVYIQSGSNCGTSKAFNMGYKTAKGKYVLWLNPDIIIENNFIFDLFSFMEKNLDCGACGGNLLGIDRKPTHSFRKKLPSLKTQSKDLSFIHRIIKKIFYKSFDNEYNYKKKPVKVGYITGADLMIRKSIMDEIGPFNEEIFMYGEESEFQFRLTKKTSYKIYSVPYAYLIHLEGGSFTKSNSFNEKRFTTFTTGNITYMKLTYGEDYEIKYLKLLKRKYKHIRNVYSFLSKKKKNEYIIKVKIISNFIEEYYKKRSN